MLRLAASPWEGPFSIGDAMPTQRQIFEALADRFEPRLRDAFLAAITEIKSGVTLRLLVERLERGDVQGALDVLQIEREAFGLLELAFVDAYNAGGIAQADALRLRDPEGNRILFRFGVRNPAAEAWVREHSSSLVTRIVDDQRESIRVALTEGLAAGHNPRTTALNIVGRTNRAINSREGGIIGLSGQQQRFVASARQELVSGDPAMLRHYLGRARRDKRFDATVLKAIREGKPLPAETVQRIVGRYADRLLALRGEMLGRTETLNALGKARDDAMSQAIASGKVDARFVTKHWRRSPAEHPRMQHTLMSGQSVPFLEPFVMSDGTRMMYPHDPSAPGRHTIGCKCVVEYRVDYIGQLVEQRRVA